MTNILVNQEQIVGKVLNLFISEENSSTRRIKNKLYLDIAGVIGDKFYNKDINRSVLISSLKSYNIADENNISMKYGALGENILMNYNPYHLTEGTQIKIGEVILEISQHCTLCKSLTKVNTKLPKVLKNDRGVFAKVIKSGFIYQNDTVIIYQL